MKYAHKKRKSSFTLPAEDVPRVAKLKKKLNLKSNTAVIKKALDELETKVDREWLRREFRKASELVKKQHKEEMQELDHLAGEGLDGY